ncbi:MAG TPA: prepilin-type N-terminal cleavage/methylation domain-containing protein [Methylomirabilota bacterium]|jgi:prepilin-type N-terminal cleavage/methylation domain-containing protein|nr:prepilin-type N-terminal cleavage/methylation domain-containing protein [Methylomirabilota bacterium]
MRERIGNQRGFTLTELIVVAAVIAMVMAGVFLLQQSGQQAYLLGSNRVETQQNARVALDMMTRELRSATSITTVGSTTDLTFVDQNGQTIRYVMLGTNLLRTADGVTRTLIGGVETLTMTCYAVYDVYNGTYTTTSTPTQVKVVKISVKTKTEEGVQAGLPGDQRALMESTIKLRATLS